MAETYLPTHFTDTESGFWLDWCKGRIDENDLVQRNDFCVIINGQAVSSLGFGTPGDSEFKRWDCLNGWTSAAHPG